VKKAYRFIRSCLNGFGFPSGPCSGGYISARKTLAAARKNHLSVREYVESIWGIQGETARVIMKMVDAGVLQQSDLRILEIGAGTGRYTELVLTNSEPSSYEIYEVAKDWRKYLRDAYPVTVHRADGVSLKHTQAQSIDVVHAHGVFVYLPFLTAYRYWLEMWRVARPGSYVVFDIYSERCFEDPFIGRWLNSEHFYPCFLSKGYVVSLFMKNNFRYLGGFENMHGAGISEYLLFQRNEKETEEQPSYK
jgi:SAM-dependent methyltransferase